MANYQKTQELFNKESNKASGLKYEKSGEQLSEEKWFKQVRNPNNGEFFQLEDLRNNPSGLFGVLTSTDKWI